MFEQKIEIETTDGSMPTFIAHPEHDGPFPVVLMLMDGVGIREGLFDQARRLASTGYYVLLPDLYYRSGPQEPIKRDQPGETERMMSLVKTVTDARAIADAKVLLDYAEDDPHARGGPAGVMGYCLGGRLSVVVAQGLGDRIGAAGAVHPGMLTNDGDTSPHKNLDQVGAELYLGIADKDDYCTPEQVSLMEDALKARGIVHEIEWHRGASHGFAVLGNEVYHKDAAERVWERLNALFARRLG